MRPSVVALGLAIALLSNDAVAAGGCQVTVRAKNTSDTTTYSIRP